jgi:hypothetical protein
MQALKSKTAEELNLIIARHMDILNGDKVSAEAIRKADSVANLIGKQLKVESTRIAYEDLRIKVGRTFKFSGQGVVDIAADGKSENKKRKEKHG